MKDENCIFCKIAAGEAPCYKVWEDDNHMAFLSLNPNTEGFTVVIPKDHYESYAFENDDKVLTDLVLAAKKVGKILDNSFDDVGRTGMVLEGFGVNHLHAKLFPMHGTKADKWEPIHSNIDTYFEKYQGYISSHDSLRASEEKLAETLGKIKK